MKVWFFYEKWKSSRGRWLSAYDAVIAQNCHITFGRNLPEAIYMAYDLIACVKEDSGSEEMYDEPFEYLNDGIFEPDSRNYYVGSLGSVHTKESITIAKIINPSKTTSNLS